MNSYDDQLYLRAAELKLQNPALKVSRYLSDTRRLYTYPGSRSLSLWEAGMLVERSSRTWLQLHQTERLSSIQQYSFARRMHSMELTLTGNVSLEFSWHLYTELKLTANQIPLQTIVVAEQKTLRIL